LAAKKKEQKYPEIVYVTIYDGEPEGVFDAEGLCNEFDNGYNVGVYKFVKTGKLIKNVEVQ